MNLKELIKHRAYELGADLVGFGNIERCRHAPPMMSPQGLFPGARTVVVMAIHHPDACIELGGEEHPQRIGPYSAQYLMNSQLDEMSYRLATFIEEQGHGAVPIVSSNIWRYNQYKDLKAIFAPDVSHIYMAVVAGLADLGYNGLALTPEYGARNRFITVITDAELEPDPLIPPGTVCDRCMLCRKHCPTQAFDKEVDGEKALLIGEYEYRFPNKNLWRCSWAEHFDLDLDLTIPDRVDESVIAESIREHGLRSGEMGQCLKFCVPQAHRHFDRGYSRTPMRRGWNRLDESAESRAVADRLVADLYARGADAVLVHSAAELKAQGIDLDAELPGAQSAVTILLLPETGAGLPGSRHADELAEGAARYRVDAMALDLTRRLDDLGFRSVMTVAGKPSQHKPVSGPLLTGQIVAATPSRQGVPCVANTVVTRKRMGARTPAATAPRRPPTMADLTRRLADLARGLGADLVGVAPAARVDSLCEQLRPALGSAPVLAASDRGGRFGAWSPAFAEETPHVLRPAVYVPGARSVMVIALRVHQEVVRHATKPPAEAVGPYAFQAYITRRLASEIAQRVAQELTAAGFRAALSADLTGTATLMANPRGHQQEFRANNFAAIAAGLGTLALNGHVVTPRFGIRQRFMAIVTDAELEPTPAAPAGAHPCEGCARPCVAACPSQAFSGDVVTVSCEGVAHRFLRVDRQRCDWSQRYALTQGSGFGFLGSTVDEPVPAPITREALDAALRRHDPIKKARPVVAQPCVLSCPLA